MAFLQRAWEIFSLSATAHPKYLATLPYAVPFIIRKQTEVSVLLTLVYHLSKLMEYPRGEGLICTQAQEEQLDVTGIRSKRRGSLSYGVLTLLGLTLSPGS